MRARILAADPQGFVGVGALDRKRLWLTTGETAAVLQMTRDGVRYLATHDGIACQRTPSGQMLFLKDEVDRVKDRRAEARLRGLMAVRPKMLRVRGKPYQLSMLKLLVGERGC